MAVAADPACLLVGQSSIDMETGRTGPVVWWLAEPAWRDYPAMYGGQRWASDGPRMLEVGHRIDADELALDVAVACEEMQP